jgi:ribosomal protein L24E
VKNRTYCPEKIMAGGGVMFVFNFSRGITLSQSKARVIKFVTLQ